MKRVLVLLVALAIVLCAAVVVWGGRLSPGPDRPGTPPVRGNGGTGSGTTIEQMMKQPPMPPQQGYIIATVCPTVALKLPPAPWFLRAGGMLQLTEEQAGKFRAALTKSEETLKPLREKAEAENRELRAAVLADVYDSAKVQELAAKAQKTEAAIATAQIEAWTLFRSILTSEQMKMLREVLTRTAPPDAGTSRTTMPSRPPSASE